MNEEDPIARAERCAEADKVEAHAALFKDAGEWLAEPLPPQHPIIKGFLEEGEMLAVVGQSKSGKSFFTLQMAICIATGISFLERETIPQKVCILNAEVSTRQYQERFQRMCKRFRIPPQELSQRLFVANLKGRDASWSALLDACKHHGCKVAFADPFYQISQIVERDEGACLEAVEQMKRFQAEGIALIVVFHSPKGFDGDKQLIDAISGSGILARFPESIIGVGRHSEVEGARVVRATLRNYAPPDPFSIVLEDGIFKVDESVAPTLVTAKSRATVSQNNTYATDNEIEVAIERCIEEAQQSADYDGYGTKKGDFVAAVKAYVKSILKKDAADRRIGGVVDYLHREGRIYQHTSKTRSATKFVGEVAIKEKWRIREGSELSMKPRKS